MAAGRIRSSVFVAAAADRAGTTWNRVPAERALVHQQIGLVVIHDEHRFTRRVRHQRLPSRSRRASAAALRRNVDPAPSVLSTVTEPPSSSASRLDSGRPSPVPFTPPLQRVLDLHELLEDAAESLRRDADAGVG